MSESGEVDAAWLSDKIGKAVASARVRDMKTMGGMAGTFSIIDIVLVGPAAADDAAPPTLPVAGAAPSGDADVPVAADAAAAAAAATSPSSTATMTVVVKTIRNLAQSITMNLWREANFYNEFASRLPQGLVPKVRPPPVWRGV